MYHRGPLNRENYVLLIEKIIDLTDTEQRIHYYILDHFNELPYYGIVDLSNNVKVSKASIGRFLNKLGFIGFSSFKQALGKNISQQKITPPFEMANKTQEKPINSTENTISKFSDKVADLFAQFTNNINIKHLEDFVDLILAPERSVYIIGPASSHSMAKHFATLLTYFKSEVKLLSADTSKLPKELVNLSNKDVLVVFSYYRFNPVVINIAKFFRYKKAIVTVITNTKTNPYAKFCDLQFALPSETETLFQSRLVGFFFVELTLQLIHERGSCKGNFEKLEELFDFFNTFSAMT